MADKKASKVCEAEGNACKKEVQALCYHCSKNLCRVHLMQHAQLIEEKTRAELHSLADKLNEVSSRFKHLSITDDILQKPFDQLEKWRVEAHEKIDQIVENKRRELNDELDKYRKLFCTKNAEQLMKLDASKKVLAELIQEADASATQIADLQGSIDDTEKYLNALNPPVINVIVRSSNWSVNVYTQFFGVQATSVDKIREFKITYVRLNGIIRNSYIKTKENGTMTDLIKSFIRHYIAVEEFTQEDTNQIYTIDHLPKQDFILPVEVYNHRVHLQYSDQTVLSNIKERDVIVFYQTPFSLDEKDNPWILMPCFFQRLPDKSSFGWPIYLKVPREGCQGQDVRDALHDALGNYFQLNSNIDQWLYEAYFLFSVNSLSKATKLDDALQRKLDFNKEYTTLLVNINSHIVDEYQQNIGAT
jgi:hypothetical protein